MADKVFLALQAVDETRSIIEAIQEDNEGVEIDHQPAMIRLTANGKLTVRAETVSEKLGYDWTPQDLQMVVISFGGNVDETDEEFTLSWGA